MVILSLAERNLLSKANTNSCVTVYLLVLFVIFDHLFIEAPMAEGRCFEFQISTTNEIKQEMNVNAMLCKQRYLFGKIYSASILLYNLLNRVADMILWISLSWGKNWEYMKLLRVITYDGPNTFFLF